jgi:glutamyl-tRNA synthetase
LVDLFSFDSVSSADGKFDMKKCESICQRVLRDERVTPYSEYLRQLVPFLIDRGLPVADKELLRKGIHLIRPRASSFVDCAGSLDYILRTEPIFDESVKTKFLTKEAGWRLAEIAALVRQAEPFEAQTIEAKLTCYIKSKNLQLKDITPLMRVALTGRSVAPGIYEVLEVLGRDASVRRLEAAALFASESA